MFGSKLILVSTGAKIPVRWVPCIGHEDSRAVFTVEVRHRRWVREMDAWYGAARASVDTSAFELDVRLQDRIRKILYIRAFPIRREQVGRRVRYTLTYERSCWIFCSGVTDEMTDKIIKFDPERRPVEIKDRKFWNNELRGKHECSHFPVVVDERLRTVQCEKCGVQLDPVQVLLEFADKFRRIDYKLDDMKRYEKKQEELRQKAKERYRKRKEKRK